MAPPITGFPLGVIMQVDTLVRPPGDVGNATTFPFPVLYRTVPEADQVVLREPSTARAQVAPWVRAAQELERAGVRAITGGCGYLAILQDILAAQVSVPVFTSALLQVPLVHRMLGPGRTVGIITANAKHLTEEYFTACGWSSREVPVATVGLEDTPFAAVLRGQEELTERDLERLADIVVRQAVALREEHPSVGAYVFECTNLPPYAAAVQRATRLPVFDIVTLIHWVHEAVARRPFTVQ
jgi:hypothetical protein